MNKSVLFVLAGLASGGLSSAAYAVDTIVNFDTAMAISPFVGTYSQNGFDVTYASGELRLVTYNPTYGNFIATIGGGSGAFDLTRTGGGVFSIGSFDAGAGRASIALSYTLAGYLAGANTYNQVFTSLSTSGSKTFTLTPTPTANLFDRIDFAFGSLVTGSSALLDNINVATIDAPPPPPPPVIPPVGAVPEPATWAMMIAGFSMVGSTMRRRKSASRIVTG